MTMFPSIAVLMKAAAWTSAGLNVLKNSCRASWLSLNSRKFLYVPKASQSLTLALPPSLTLATTGHLAGHIVDHTPQRQLDRRALNDRSPQEWHCHSRRVPVRMLQVPCYLQTSGPGGGGQEDCQGSVFRRWPATTQESKASSSNLFLPTAVFSHTTVSVEVFEKK